MDKQISKSSVKSHNNVFYFIGLLVFIMLSGMVNLGGILNADNTTISV